MGIALKYSSISCGIEGIKRSFQEENKQNLLLVVENGRKTSQEQNGMFWSLNNKKKRAIKEMKKKKKLDRNPSGNEQILNGVIFMLSKIKREAGYSSKHQFEVNVRTNRKSGR